MKLNVKRCCELMQERHINMTDIEKMTGITLFNLDWIFENRYVEVGTLERIANVLQCDTDDIALLDDYGNENVIEFLKGQSKATVTFSQGRYKTRIKKLAEKFPEECNIIAENQNGSICAHIPVAWLRINPPMSLTEEQRQHRAKLMRQNIFHSEYNRCEKG